MAKPARRQVPAALRVMFPDPPPGWPDSPWAALLAFSSAQTFRVEELVRDDQYVIRAELPGLDPATGIEVTVDGGILTIRADRCRQDDEPRRTEFRYGSVTRSVRLPARVEAQEVTARYRKGILEVSIPMPSPVREGTRIPIENADAPGSTQAADLAAGSAGDIAGARDLDCLRSLQRIRGPRNSGGPGSSRSVNRTALADAIGTSGASLQNRRGTRVGGRLSEARAGRCRK
jgi:HSP20 family protein